MPSEPLKEPAPRPLCIVCAWCGRVLRAGPPGALPSHGICTDCRDRELTARPHQTGPAAR
jgi:hypothetical protein